MDEIREAVVFAKDYFGRIPVVGAEVGVFEGRNATRLLNNLNITKLHLIDKWDPSYYDIPKDYHSEVVEKFKSLANKVNIIKASSSEAVDNFKDGLLDFVYIDADHSYEGCLEDLNLWYPKVRSGGIVCGHDYYIVPKVAKAVDEFFYPLHLYVIVFDSVSCFDNVKYGEWLVIKP